MYLQNDTHLIFVCSERKNDAKNMAFATVSEATQLSTKNFFLSNMHFDETAVTH